MICARKLVGRGDYEDLIELTQRIQRSLKAPHDVMLLKIEHDRSHDCVFVGMPNRKRLRGFAGFDEIPQKAIPQGAAPLVLRTEGLVEALPDIAKKIGMIARGGGRPVSSTLSLQGVA